MSITDQLRSNVFIEDHKETTEHERAAGNCLNCYLDATRSRVAFVISEWRANTEVISVSKSLWFANRTAEPKKG